MSEELDLWVRVIQNVIGLVLVIPAMAICFGLFLEARRLYLLFGALAFFWLAPLLIVRIAAIPDPPLFSRPFIEAASLIINAIWPLFGLAWLVGFLYERLHLTRVRRKHHFDEREEES